MATSNMADPTFLVSLSAIIAAFSGMPGLLRNSPVAGQKIGNIAVILASITGLTGVTLFFIRPSAAVYTAFASLPFGPCEFAVDYLSALFLIPLLIIAACCSLYGTGYWPAAHNLRTSRKLTFFFGLLTASLIFLIIAKNSILFLIAWEIMALSAYFVLTTDDHVQEVRNAGIIYMVATHTGTLLLFALFSLLHVAASSYQFSAMAALQPALPLATGIFCTALLGFGLKAGLMPLHIGLPAPLPWARSHISAVMSGLMIKTGVYGMLRVLSFFPHPPLWWGIVLLIAGISSAILGVVFALGQHDLKRLLAYHSIENIGIIFMGMGLAVVGQSTGEPLLVILGMAGALLHTVNHAMFKSLLFLGAGSVIHASHSREIDQMGGYARHLPWTAGLFLLGAVAICGLPPLNGFISEYFIYMGMFRGIIHGEGPAAPVIALAAPALAMVGALAVACFVKVYGTVFLGANRHEGDGGAKEACWSMRAPMVVLASLCVVVGVFPLLAAKVIQPVITWYAPDTASSGHSLATGAPLGWVTVLALSLLVVTGILACQYLRRLRQGEQGCTATWGCGYLAPTPRMQYTSSSFAEMVVKIFAAILRPHGEKVEIKGVFPGRHHFASHVPEVVLELLMLPFFRSVDQRFSVIRRLQHGQLHLYILYVFITLCLLIAWAM